MGSRGKKDIEKRTMKRIWHVVKFVSSGKIVSVPNSWIKIKNEKVKSGETVTTASCYWTQTIMSESKLLNMVMNQKPPDKSWKLQEVNILATAKTLPELMVKENMAKNPAFVDIDTEYTNENREDSKANRRNKCKKPLGEDYVSGGGLSKSSPDTSSDSSEGTGGSEDSENEMIPPRTPFKKPRLSRSSDSDQSEIPESKEEKNVEKRSSLESDLELSDTESHLEKQEFKAGLLTPGEVSTFSNELIIDANEEQQNNEIDEESLFKSPEDTNEKSWCILKLKKTNMCYIMPAFWVDADNMTCFFPPLGASNVDQFYVQDRKVPQENWQRALEIAVLKSYTEDYMNAREVLRTTNDLDQVTNAYNTLMDDEKEAEKNDENRTKMLRIKNQENLTGLKKIKIQNASTRTLTNAELDKMDVRDLLRLTVRQNEEIIKSNCRILTELQTSNSLNSARHVGGSKIKPAHGIFPIKNAKKLLELEQQLVTESEQFEINELRDGNLTDRVITFFQNQGGRNGHAAMVNMISNSLDDSIQARFNFKGRRKNGKLPFENLELWKLMRNTAVSQYHEVDNYNSQRAEESCKQWLKAAPERLRRANEKENNMPKYKNDKLEQLAQQEEDK